MSAIEVNVVNSQNVTFNVIVSAIEVNISSSLSPTVLQCYCVLRLSSTVRMSHSMLSAIEVNIVANSQNVTFNVIVSAIEVNILLCRQQSECHIQC